jgi:hypothetical protein
MADIDPTPGTPVTLLDAMGWWRGELRDQITTLAGAPTPKSMYDIWTAITAQEEHQLDILNSMADSIGRIETYTHGMSINLTNYLPSILARLISVEEALGGGSYASLEIATVRGLLAALLAKANSFGIAPSTTGGEIASVAPLSVDGKRWACWPDEAEYTRSTDLTLITPLDGWTGWQMYVRTNAPACYVSVDGTVDSQMPVNSWFPLDSFTPDTIGVYVDSAYDIGALLRPAPAQAFDLFSSELVTWSSPSGTASAQAIVWPGRYTPSGASADNYWVPDKTIWATTNISGRTVTLVSGGAVNIMRTGFGNGNFTDGVITSANSPYALGSYSGPFGIQLQSATPFTVQLS